MTIATINLILFHYVYIDGLFHLMIGLFFLFLCLFNFSVNICLNFGVNDVHLFIINCVVIGEIIVV